MPDEMITLTQDERHALANLQRLHEAGRLEEMAAVRPGGGSGYLNLSWNPRPLTRAYSKRQAARSFASLPGGVGSVFAQPNIGDVHIDQALTNVSIAYMNPIFVAGEIFPSVPVQFRTGKWFTFGKGEWGRAESGLRGYADEPVTVGYSMSTASYAVEEHAWQMALDVRLLGNADPGAAPETVAAEFVANQSYLDKENTVAALVMTASNWDNTVTLTGTAQWSDITTTPLASHPIQDVMNAHDVVTRATLGTPPNTIVMGLPVFLKLMMHPDILQRVLYGGTNENPAMVTARALAQLFRVERVLIGQTVKNTGAEGVAYNASYIWGKDVWIGYVAPMPSLMRPTAGLVFTMGLLTDRFFWQLHKALYVRAAEDYDVRVTSSAAGYTIKNAVA